MCVFVLTLGQHFLPLPFPFSPICSSAGAAGPGGASREKRYLPGLLRRLGSGSGLLDGLGEMSCRKEGSAPPATGPEVGRVTVVRTICKVPGASLSAHSVPGQALGCTPFPHIISFSVHESPRRKEFIYFLN